MKWVSKAAVLAAISFGLRSWGAACCGGTANVPSIVTGDDRGQLSLSTSISQMTADASVEGTTVARGAGDTEWNQGLTVEGAAVVAERWQVGFRVPALRKARSRGGRDANAWGLGDVAASAAYEVLPEWAYSSWRPKGFIFFGVTAPTGPSQYEATEVLGVGVRGPGYWRLSAGILLQKTWGNWDGLVLAEVHRSLSRTVSLAGEPLGLVPGFGGSGSLGMGWSPGGGNLRLGLNVAPQFEQGVRTEGLVAGQGADIRLWTASLQGSYLVASDLSATLAYSDSLILGGHQNAPLGRSVSFLIQKRWER